MVKDQSVQKDSKDRILRRRGGISLALGELLMDMFKKKTHSRNRKGKKSALGDLRGDSISSDNRGFVLLWVCYGFVSALEKQCVYEFILHGFCCLTSLLFS
ncbi:hypothetical protein Bca4012_066241 [Brassica carinata]